MYPVEAYQQYQPYEAFPPPHPHPAFQQKRVEPASQHIRHNKNYWCPLGWIRLFILISTLAGVITSWCVVSSDANFSSLEPGLVQTRSALIVIFSIWFSLSLLIFLMSVTNFVNLPGLDSKYYLYAFILVDFLGACAFIGVGVAAAVKEANLIWLGALAYAAYRPGTFIACAVFAFFTAIMELISVGYQGYIVYQLDFF